MGRRSNTAAATDSLEAPLHPWGALLEKPADRHHVQKALSPAAQTGGHEERPPAALCVLGDSDPCSP